VLSGRAMLRTPEGTRELEPGAVVAFRRGPEGAHTRLRTRVISRFGCWCSRRMNLPEITELVTTGAMFVRASHDGPRKAFPGGSEQEFLAIWRAAFDADRA